jgi:predicted membrane-bound spermidine synthase
LHLKRKVLFQILDDHHQKRQLDPQSTVLLSRAGNIVCRDIGTNDFQDGRLDVVVSDTFDVAVADFFVPDLEGFGPMVYMTDG